MLNLPTIDGLVVCENYSDYFAQCASSWAKNLRSVLVVTSNRDEATQKLASDHGFDVFKTDVFWEHGAKFNKGAAIAQAYESREWNDWVLFFDADIKPPEDLLERLPAIEPGTLYGAKRILENGKAIEEGEIVGAFSLFHSSDKHAQNRPIVDTHWEHCGNYDSVFQGQWDADKKVRLAIEVLHIGSPFTNWCGRGNDAAMRKMWAMRRANHGWAHERIRK